MLSVVKIRVMMNIEYQFEFLCHAMRLQLEQIVKYPDLVEVDSKEAIFNVEISIKSSLDAFHNVYDVIQELSNKSINWYEYPELHFILSLRNAKHHNKGLKSIFFENKNCIYVDFLRKDGEGFPCIIYPVRWIDIYNYIMSDKKGKTKYESLSKYLNVAVFEEEADRINFSTDLIYINIIPLMLQAGKRLVYLCEKYIPNQLTSCEAKFFLNHFKSIPEFYPKIKFPYNLEIYKKDIDSINKFTQIISKLTLGSNPYFEDIQYKK